MKIRFTFKTDKPTGSYASFFDPHHNIKLNGNKIGSIGHKKPHKIRLMIMKDETHNDGNPNCSWMWTTLKKESETLQGAKDWLNENAELIMAKYKIRK